MDFELDISYNGQDDADGMFDPHANAQNKWQGRSANLYFSNFKYHYLRKQKQFSRLAKRDK